MKTLNLSWFEDFLALAANGNFSRAADERHMTQPAFSRRIRALEAWVGAELFDRSVQPATLTDTGQWFDAVARDLLARAAKIPGEAQAFHAVNSTTLRIASTHALSFTFMPQWLRGLEARIEIGQVRLVSDVLQRCETMLMESQVQFLLTHAPVDSKNNLDKHGYPYAVVGKDWLVPVSAPKKDGTPAHALNKGTVKNPSKLLSYSTESGLSRIVDITHAKLSKHLPTKTVFTAHLASVLRTMAIDGRGVAWLPQTLVTDDLEHRLLVAAAPKSWCVDMQIRLYRDKATISQAAENFWRNNPSQTAGVLA